MEISVASTQGLEREMTVAIPAAEFEKKVTDALQQLKSKVKIKGFRPGKVPNHIMRQQYGASVQVETAQKLMQESLEQALKEKELMPTTMPKITPKQMEPGKPFEYTATFEVYPQIELTIPSEWSFERKRCEVQAEDIDQAIETLRKQHIQWQAEQRAAQSGDKVVIDFTGFIDDKPFEGGEAKDFQMVLGDKRMIPGFEEGLINAKAQENVTLTLNFPEDYPHKELAGKPARFEVTVKEVMSPQLPELTEDFIRENFDIESGKLADLRAQVQENMQKDVQQKTHHLLKLQVLEKLAEANAMEIPESLVKAEAQVLARERQPYAQQQELPVTAEMEQEARKRVVRGLLVQETIKHFSIEIDQPRVEQKLFELTEMYQDAEYIRESYLKNPQLMSRIQSTVLEDQAVEKLLENAQMKEADMSYQALMETRV
jgi:trigger factor